MDNIQKMFQAIINGQSTLKQELLKEIKKVNQNLDQTRNDLTERIDKIGMQLAYLEDDAPTREEFENLEKKVDKLIQKSTPAAR